MAATRSATQVPNYGETETELQEKIQDLFDKARAGAGKACSRPTPGSNWDAEPPGVCVSSLEKVKLFNSNLGWWTRRSDYLINQSPARARRASTSAALRDRHVREDARPTRAETLIDTAAGGAGFPVHASSTWERIMQEEGLTQTTLFTTEKKPARCEDYVRDWWLPSTSTKAVRPPPLNPDRR